MFLILNGRPLPLNIWLLWLWPNLQLRVWSSWYLYWQPGCPNLIIDAPQLHSSPAPTFLREAAVPRPLIGLTDDNTTSDWLFSWGSCPRTGWALHQASKNLFSWNHRLEKGKEMDVYDEIIGWKLVAEGTLDVIWYLWKLSKFWLACKQHILTIIGS